MMALGIWNLEASFSAKGFYAMAAIMLVHTAVTLTKTMRDREEANKFHNRLEDAKTEKTADGHQQAGTSLIQKLNRAEFLTLRPGFKD